MTVSEINSTQLLLLKARANNYANYKPSRELPAEHGVLTEDIDHCLALGLLKHGYDEELPGDLSSSVFVPFNKCLHYCMQNGISLNKDHCEICDTIADLSKHTSKCLSHPEICSGCKSFFNLLEYHLKNCYTCDMHLCTKLKLKMMKYNYEVRDGLLELWSKIQQYVSRFLPAAVVLTQVPSKNGIVRGSGETPCRGRFPSVFDSVSLTPPKPMVVARSPGGHSRMDTDAVRAEPRGLGDSHQIQLMPDPTAGLSFSMGQPFYPDQNLNSQAIQDDYMNDMNKIAQTFQETMTMAYAESPVPDYSLSHYHPAGPGYPGASPVHPGASPAHLGASPGHPGFSINQSQYFTGVTVPSATLEMNDNAFISHDMYSVESNLKPNDGCGCVINGEPRQLRALAQYWERLKQKLQGGGKQNNIIHKTETDGVLLQGKSSGMAAVDGQYKKNKEWRKVTYIGSGVAGKCYLAVDMRTEAQFAVKKIELLKYQAEELEHWTELEHPNLVQMFGALRVNNKIYIFSEFYAAGNVADFIEQSHMLDQWLSVYFLQQLFDALTYLKRKGVLHEDIKADNIFLKPDSYQLGLGDFGLCRKKKCPPNEKPVGGMHHWSPEKAKSEGHSFPSDVWAVTCTFVHMLSGDPPWRRRFKDVPILHFTIGSFSPPVEDIPEGLIEMVHELIKRAWTCDPNERPTAQDLLQDDCFQILNYDHMDPVFRSHIPEIMEDEEMEMSGAEMSNYSLDYILEGIDDKKDAIEYIQNLCATISQEETESGQTGGAAGGATGGATGGAFGGVSTTPLASPSATSMRRQFSGRAPQMASIREEDLSLSAGDLHMDIPSKDEKERPAISPLIMPDNATLAKRQEYGKHRSDTSPSPSTGGDFYSSRRELHRSDTSPAAVSSMSSTHELSDQLLGEKDIFSLNPGTSGYGTATSSYHYPPNDDSMSLRLSSNEPTSSHQGHVSAYYDPTSGTWPDSAPPTWTTATEPMTVPYHTASPYSTHLNMMEPIALKPDLSPNRSSAPLVSFDYDDSMRNLRESLSSSVNGGVETKSILTIVNGNTQLDDIEVLVRANELWSDIVETNFHKVAAWNIIPYTYYLENGEEIALHQEVPKDKTNVFIYQTKEGSSWHVNNGRIEHTKTRIRC